MLYEKRESLHSNYSDITDSNYIERLVPFCAICYLTVATKSTHYYCMCIVDYVSVLKRLSDNIRQTKRVVSVKISSHDPSFTSNHFKFHFISKTYCLASDEFCNLSAVRVFAGTNGEDAKKISKLLKSLIDYFHC